ncbi:heparan-alpha-glucosaminide N-acetyltransferase domain-containing protein [Leucobacter massiliensis]|uniref:Heparan-alpha-glucosaminide N-acetyltransferase catalytic domain-containing protein n=1 Tax=Leucobacter massiliensis TaxID=1686285 RepID=A0A2S9QN14_9MICO|nr:heparan-alpha-glucosaminide N-acetyltransferase domain-containing protein [Leucobacter massiliensis]PRI10983.1 hypothetical protein B4915_08870 [Leucobacter massiliensis]
MTSAETAEQPLERSRFVGVDLARLLAIAGMMAAHLITIVTWDPFAPESALSVAAVTDTLTDGIAAPLFAVLGGLSAVFATRRLHPERHAGPAITAVAVRGALILLLGLWLGMLDDPFVVVLAYYGAAMLLVAPLIAARGWLIAAIAVVLGLAGGPLNAAVRAALDIDGFEGRAVSFATFGADWTEAIRALLLTGIYPAITWAVYLLAGVLAGRALVAAGRSGTLTRLATGLAVAGAVLAATAQLSSNLVRANPVSYGYNPAGPIGPEAFAESGSGAPLSTELWAQLLATPHSGSPVDIARTVGIALAVIGLLVLLCDRDMTPRGARVPRLLDVLRSTGAAPLTIYALHIWVTAWSLGPVLRDQSLLTGDTLPWWAFGPDAFALQLAVAIAIGAVLSFTGRRGPLEALLSDTVALAVGRGR